MPNKQKVEKAKKVARKSKREVGMKSNIEKMTAKMKGMFSAEPTAVVDALKMDHDSLREFIKILKDTSTPIAKRKSAYRSFASLLKSHSRAEEEIVYAAASEFSGRELHIKVAEGLVEHNVCDDLMARIANKKDPLAWSAHVNVISEILEHHLKEEERDLFPLIKKQVTAQADQELTEMYINLRSQTQKIKSEKNKGVLATH